MGRKNKNKSDDHAGDEFKEGDFTKGFVSHKANIAQEAAAAERDLGDSDDDGAGQKLSKKQKQKLKQKAQQVEDFDAVDKKEQIKSSNKDDDDSEEVDIQKAMKDNFDGNAAAKRNTRKKKKGADQGGLQEDAFAGVFDDHSGSDKDEVYNKKGGYKNNKKDRQQGKKKKVKEESEEEPAEEEKGAEPEDDKPKEPEIEEEAPEFPMNVVYCPKCKLPPEYCSFGQKDSSECKELLRGSHPLLFKQIYNEDAGEVVEKKDGDKEEKKEKKEGDEETKGEDGEEEKKPKKKVKFNKELGVINIHKQIRGGKKVICQIVGMEHYTKDMKGLATKMGKKFACGCNLAKDDILGDCISVQGDIEYRFEDLIEGDKDFMKLEIPLDKIRYEEMGNKKGRKRA